MLLDGPALVVLGGGDTLRGLSFRSGDFLLGGQVDALGVLAGLPLAITCTLSGIPELGHRGLGGRSDALDLSRSLRSGALEVGEGFLSSGISLGTALSTW